MSKIQQIKIQALKAIDDLTVDFKGCTAIVTGRNNSGKTTLLRSMPDRIRFIRPTVIVKEGSTQGKGEMTLDSGERFVWNFDAKGKDQLQLFTAEGAKRDVTKTLGATYFPSAFDIDKFLQATPKVQAKELQKALGVDFSDIEDRYAKAYQVRTDKNKDAEKFHVKLTEMMECPKVDFVDLTELQGKKEAERLRLNELYKKNKGDNDKLRSDWQIDINAFNIVKAGHTARLTSVGNAIDILNQQGYKGTEVHEFYASIKDFTQIAPIEPTYTPEMPSDAVLQQIDAAILAASQTNTKAQAYKDYIEYKQRVATAKEEAEQADNLVKEIEAERLQMIASCNFPKGISILNGDLTIDGLPIDRTQISSSRITIAALQIAAINLGEVKALFFDASYLDRKSLNEVNTWAESMDLQLLIEKPTWEDSEIEYRLIENGEEI